MEPSLPGIAGGSRGGTEELDPRQNQPPESSESGKDGEAVIVYELYDGDEIRTYHTSKAEAIKEARELQLEHPFLEVNKLWLGKVRKELILSLLAGGAYCEKQETVWRTNKVWRSRL